jgi:DNA-binding transcriptional regulator YhcF (GntR family)
MSPDGSDALAIELDRDAEVPLGVQLAWALRARILTGALAAGDRLPALHRLADQLGVNANTIRAVYQRLEQDGLVATRHGSGTFVTGSGDGEGGALAQLAANAARAAHDAGIDPREVAAALYMGADSAGDADSDAIVRRRLRAQIAALEQTLSERPGHQSRPVPTPATTGGQPAPRARLLSAAELTYQRDELLRRLADTHTDPGEPDDPNEPAQRPARRRSSTRSPQLRAAPRAT